MTGRSGPVDLAPRPTAAGAVVLVLAAAAALSGLDPDSSRLYVLFSGAVSLMLVSMAVGPLARPRALLSRTVGPLGMVGLAVPYRVTLVPTAGRPLDQLELNEALPAPLRFADSGQRRLPPVPAEGLTLTLSVVPQRRGVYRLEGPVLSSTYPFGLVRFPRRHAQPARLLVHPRIYPVGRLDVPVARRHQPGGIPLASATGESCEFFGTREYREGDSLRSIHWKSWARVGNPVVIEYQQEYFCRLGVVLDTFARTPEEVGRLEAAVSVAGSLVHRVAEGEHVLDVFISGNLIYRLQAGRHLADLASIMEVLSCVEPSREEPFTTVQAHVLDSLEGLSCLVVVLLNLDEPRQAFLRRLQGRGAVLKVLLVGGRGTGEWQETELPPDPDGLARALAAL